MNTIAKKIIVSITFVGVLPAFAQNTATGYFNDGYLYRHEMNPAISNSQSYVAMPGISNINVGLRSNIGVKDVLFKRNGKTTTFLNPNVSSGEFLSNINEKNRTAIDLKVQLLGLGFKGFKGYNHFGINVRSNVAARKVKELITLMMESLVISKKPYEEQDFAKDLTVEGFTTVECKGYDYLVEKSMTLDKVKDYPDSFAAQLLERNVGELVMSPIDTITDPRFYSNSAAFHGNVSKKGRNFAGTFYKGKVLTKDLVLRR